MSARAAQKTPIPRIPLLLSDILNGLLPSDGPDIVDAEACLSRRENVFTGRFLAMDFS
jgi:hypothetical protein